MAAFYPTDDFEGSKFHVQSQTFIFTGTTATRSTPPDWSNNEGENGSGLDLEKLKIGSPMKRSVGPVESSPLMLCDSDNSSRPSSPPRTIECRPLWKDYPSVEKSFPSGHSFCSSPYSCYTASSLCSPVPVGFNGFKPNYKSSSIGTIFGSHKSLISPPKLDITNWGYQRQDGDNISVYGSGSGAHPSRSSTGFVENGSTYTSCRPVSRASSQSSGFISQNGYYTPPPSLRGFRVAPSVTESLRNHNRHNFDSGASMQSEMSWYSSANVAENGRERGHRSNPFGTMCSQARSSSFDTCSRFARSSDDRNRSLGLDQHRIISRRSNSTEFTDDEVDEDCVSFRTARTSATIARKPVFGRASFEGARSGSRQRNEENETKAVALRNLMSSEFGENQTSNASVWTRVGRFTWNVARNMLLLVGVIVMLMLLGMIFTDLSGDKVNEHIRYLITYTTVFYAYLEKMLIKEYHNLLVQCESGYFRVEKIIMEFVFRDAER